MKPPYRHKCMECAHEFNGDAIRIDGVVCPLCSSRTDIIGEAIKEPPKEKLRIVVTDDHKMQVYMDGKRVKGIMSISFRKRSGEFATHIIEYATGNAEHSEENKNV